MHDVSQNRIKSGNDSSEPLESITEAAWKKKEVEKPSWRDFNISLSLCCVYKIDKINELKMKIHSVLEWKKNHPKPTQVSEMWKERKTSSEMKTCLKVEEILL